MAGTMGGGRRLRADGAMCPTKVLEWQLSSKATRNPGCHLLQFEMLSCYLGIPCIYVFFLRNLVSMLELAWH